MTRILFVCHGNICRSPMAEFCMKDLVRAAGRERDFEIASAATSREEIGNPVYPPARRMLAAHGISCAGKTARQIVPGDYAYYDLIVGMDEENMRALRRAFGGDPDGKIVKLLARDVADPWYTGDFGVAWRDIDEGCRALFEKIARRA